MFYSGHHAEMRCTALHRSVNVWKTQRRALLETTERTFIEEERFKQDKNAFWLFEPSFSFPSIFNHQRTKNKIWRLFHRKLHAQKLTIFRFISTGESKKSRTNFRFLSWNPSNITQHASQSSKEIYNTSPRVAVFFCLDRPFLTSMCIVSDHCAFHWVESEERERQKRMVDSHYSWARARDFFNHSVHEALFFVHLNWQTYQNFQKSLKEALEILYRSEDEPISHGKAVRLLQ